MAVAISYDISGEAQAHESLRALASKSGEVLDHSIEHWVKEERAFLKRFGYPPQRGIKQPFKTDRSRRYFFWALRQGLITVPYHRTGVLASSWRTAKISAGHYALENSAAYAALVIGSREQQARYHRDWWWTSDSVVGEDVIKLSELITEGLLGLID